MIEGELEHQLITKLVAPGLVKAAPLLRSLVTPSVSYWKLHVTLCHSVSPLLYCFTIACVYICLPQWIRGSLRAQIISFTTESSTPSKVPGTDQELNT